MPICKSCLKGFNSEVNICPHCGHEQSRRSFRTPITLIVLVLLSIFLYTIFLSKFTITVLHDGVPKKNVVFNPYMKIPKKTDENGIVKLRKGYCNLEFSIGEETLKWEFLIDSNITFDIDTKNKALKVTTQKHIFFEDSYTFSFKILKLLEASKKASTQQLKSQQD